MSKAAYFKFRLYIVGDSPNATLAVANLKAICRDYFASRHEIEIVDVLREPERAMADGVLLTPTLIKLSPLPVRTIIGNLSQIKPVLLALDIPDDQ